MIHDRNEATVAQLMGPSGEEESTRALGWPAPLDLRELAVTDPEPPQSIIEDWLPAGYATLVAGHGGSGKSGAVAMPAAVCMAAGRPFYGLHVERRRVMYMSFEDRTPILHWRLTRICRHLELDMAGLSDLVLLDLVGQPAILWAGDALPMAYGYLRKAIAEHQPDVIVIDGIADVFAGNENSRSDVKAFIASLLALIDPDRGAVLLVGHVAKAAAGGAGGEGYSGSTGWHNSVRARWYLYPETERDEDGGTASTGEMILQLTKSNFGPSGQQVRLRWDDDAQCFTGHREASASHFERREQDETERACILAAMAEVAGSDDYVPAAMQGPRTAHHVLAAAESFPEALRGKAATKRFRRHIEHLRRNHEISESSIRRANRSYVATLELKSTSAVACTNARYSGDGNECNSGAVHQCTNAPHSPGGYGGFAHTHPSSASPCPKCAGEGCGHCHGGTR